MRGTKSFQRRLPTIGVSLSVLGVLGGLSGCGQLLGIEETSESPCYPEICAGSGGTASGGGSVSGGGDTTGGAATSGGGSSGGAPSMGGSPGGSGGEKGGSPSGGIGEEASGGASSTGGAEQGGTGGDGSGGDGDGTGGQTQGGPVLIEVDGFSIDATEVTNAQYEEFLTSKDGDTSGQPEECAFNTDYTPSSAWPGASNEPVRYVDWCDAWTFCQWADKRLCSGIGGSVLSLENVSDETASEWFRACAGAAPTGANYYPYGSTYQEVCNDDGYQSANDDPGPVEVGSLDQCEGSPSGVFDMVGNVVEWIDSCDGKTGADDLCTYIGGSYNTEAVHCANSAITPVPRSQSAPALGFRCCDD